MNARHCFQVKAPGRVFLFGEHSDYLGLEVISAAINRYITIRVTKRNDQQMIVNYLDLGEKDDFTLDKEVPYRHKRDYLRSAFNILRRKGIQPARGANLEVTGDIPIAAGLSSSSALSVATVIAFAKLANCQLTTEEIAQFAFEAEVCEFNESGGMMDHIASAYGGIVHVDFGQTVKPNHIETTLEGLVIGDSLEKKEDTVGDLKMIRETVEKGYQLLNRKIDEFDPNTTSLELVIQYSQDFPEHCKRMTRATIRNRDLTRKALKILTKELPNPAIIGKLIDEEHKLLRDELRRSTKKIERMIEAAKEAGAIGCKINGSGGGGTILAYAPHYEQEVTEALKKVGGVPYQVEIANGPVVNTRRE
ncbi:MAG: GHMP kinase [Candidatus Heimdallarchaeota archaeon]|nr:GHMP kinase [Candidatus Heimdallarchaeota archaeon]